VVPPAELEVSRRRCCCGGSEVEGIPCPECPEAISPCTTPEYSISIAVDVGPPDAAGDGCLAVPTYVLDCMRGSCGRQTYRRKALSTSTFALGVCDTADMCQSMKDEAAPVVGGDVRLRWQACDCDGDIGFLVASGNPCIVDYEQEGAVFIEWIDAQVYWNTAACAWSATAPPGIADDCRSVVRVLYTYTDSFSFPMWDDAPPNGCTDVGSTYSVTRQWICYYSRRVQAGEFMAEGAYRLVRCEYPAAANTIGPTGGWNAGCGLNGGIVCSADGLSSIGKVPTIWQPPATITVVREC
jgi:hypothetical protein